MLALFKSMLILAGMILLWALSVNTHVFKVDFGAQEGQESELSKEQ